MAGIASRALTGALALGFIVLSGLTAFASPTCPDQRATPQVPKDLALCKKLEPIVRNPSGFALNDYENALDQYLQALCHRDVGSGWKRDKYVRDTGSWIGTYRDRKWKGQYYGTHAPVLIWYSPDFYKWLKTNRPEQGPVPADPQPVPDGAMIVKEMYTPPADACASIDPSMLLPVLPGAAVMVRDSKGANDGWFWGWYGWAPAAGWKVDWPAKTTSPYPNMGFGQYCTNCHASAKDNQTFAALKNIEGDLTPLVFLSQNFFLDPSWQNLQTRVVQSADQAAAATARAEPPYNPAFTKIFPPRPRPTEVVPHLAMPPATYDNVWVKPGAPTAASQFVTSDQCVGCHSAGGTGLQFDMTQPATDSKLLNISPYGTWRGSPMGLAGRDPIFFAQLASEVDTFHAKSSPLVQDTCLGCHGILGQRQNAIDSYAQTGKCAQLTRSILNAVPYGAAKPAAKAEARYGALGRDGISCASCHHMVLGEKMSATVADDPQNKCVAERQDKLNPKFTGFAKTFTGSFFVGPPDKLYGPFEEPKVKPMKHALGIEPAHSTAILSSELCGSCHTVHLPILKDGRTLGYVYEQTTYPEWAFSDFRTGDSPDGMLPYGAGPAAQSCQACHMPNKDALGNPYRSKIASIQEYTSFPQAEHTLDRTDIDLKERAGFGKHTLVGLNVFFLKMAEQFYEMLGVRPGDPMLTKDGIDSIPAAVDAMIDQGINRTAMVTIGDVANDGATLAARVTVINLVGHKFPSGVGFRRAFLQFDVLDVDGKRLWSSGRTDSAGVIVDANGKPILGELWWKDDCSARIEPEKRIHQKHYQEITSQDQAQIYQELVSTAPDGAAATGPDAAAPKCGPSAPPAGQLTTSFLSICTKVKDNRLLPRGFLSLEQRKEISKTLGADDDMALETDPVGVEGDPDFGNGSDSLVYRVPLADLKGVKPISVQATLFYQATPPFYLQDRFCTSRSDDTLRLYYVAGKLDLAGTLAEDWKLRVVTSGPVPVP
jgi:hypothetical protein